MKHQRIRKPTKFEELTRSTRKQHSHLHSQTVIAKRQLLQLEHEQLESRLVALATAITVAKERRAIVAATLQGLDLVLETR